MQDLRKYSGRVGRSAAEKDLDREAVQTAALCIQSRTPRNSLMVNPKSSRTASSGQRDRRTLFSPDFQAPDEDDGFATQADTKKNIPTNLIRFQKRESN